MAKTESIQKLKTGYKVPEFNLKGIDGKEYTLNDFKSKALLIVFICNHCPYVKARIKDIIKIQSKFSENELCVVGINSNDPNYTDEGFENMKKFSKHYDMNFPYLIDEKQNIALSFGAVCTPDPFLFNQDRRLVFHGKINDATNPEMIPKINIMEDNIKKILNDEKIEKDFDPSIGCSIKWVE
ncbi:MAG: thioredoxin family protein [Nitrososphaeraceae archaeon]